MTTESNALTYIKLLLMAFFWGGTFIAGRLLVGEVSPFSAAFLRFTIASATLLCLTRRHCGPFRGSTLINGDHCYYLEPVECLLITPSFLAG